jgi:TonB family protein
MDLAVDQVLTERSEHGRGAVAASVLGAVLVHALVVVAAIILPRLSGPKPPLDFVDVTVVPAAALGSPPPPAPTPAPTPPKPAAAPPEPATAAPVLPVEKPKPQPKPEPAKPEPPDTRVDPTTRPKVLPAPREILAQRTARETPPPPAAPAPTVPPATHPGTANGTANGTAPVGSSITNFDNPDFTYDYYTAQLLAAIDRAWTRPPVADGAHAIVSFHILRDGSITDLAVRETSGFNNFDLSALRAVQNAAPFPPLPRGYHHDWLGVNLMVR